jgi:hypothetical protein
MTNDEIAAEIKKRREAIEAIKGEISDLKNQFAGKWKVGDVYEIPDGENRGRFRVACAPFDDNGYQPEYKMKVNKIKKDGTPSAQFQYPYGIKRGVKVLPK